MFQHYVSSGYVSPGYYQTGISIDWATKTIFVPKFYLTPISGSSYLLDTNQFRNDLKNLEDDAEGMAYPDTHRHNTQVVLSGITYARVIEIINGYTVTFEDGLYSVSLVGSNNNIPDVLNLNQVSVRASNSAGLQIVNTSGGVGTAQEVAAAVWDGLASDHNMLNSMGSKLNAVGASADPWSTDLSIYTTPGTAGYIVNTNLDAKVSDVNVVSVTGSLNTRSTSATLIHGTEVGTYLDTYDLNDVFHVISPTANNLEVEYEFNITGKYYPSSATVIGYIAGTQTAADVYALLWQDSTWHKVGVLAGKSASVTASYTLFAGNVGTGIDEGKVKLRFVHTGADKLYIDQLYVSVVPATGFSDSDRTVLNSVSTDLTTIKGYTDTLETSASRIEGYTDTLETSVGQLQVAVADVPTAAEVAAAVRTELTIELTHIMQIPTSSSSGGLTESQANMLLEMYDLLGLDPLKPLLVTKTQRRAGSIIQSITGDSNSTTVTRI